ncbi:uncharacterized protein [Solanum tuberosum]|uniref:uncharacterized protein n=1 Tax=Solanum tuberosum TaxID=4113 RepID=UPI00073A4E4D|nr:PREDICTED: uncharacterized protein LOC107059330 [Solanum tuberosum]
MCVVFLIMLLSIITTSPLAHAQFPFLGPILGPIFGPIPIVGPILGPIVGQPIIPPVGQVPPIVPPFHLCHRKIPPIGGIVAIICGNTTLAQVITNVEGLINVTLSTNTNILFGNTSTLSCVARVALPIVNCTLLPTSGILQAPLMLVGNIIQGVGGVVLSALVGTFSLVAVMI